MISKIKNFFFNDILNKILVYVFCLIFLINIFLMGLDYLDIIRSDFFMFSWFDVNSEFNPPAFFNGTLFFIITLRVANIIRLDNWKAYEKFAWMIIGLVFVFLGLDEIFQIHENQPESWNLHSKNWFKYYLMAFGVLSLPCIPMFLRLNNVFKLLFILSGLIFLGGAVGLESVSLYFSSKEMWKLYKIFYLLEEFFEMLGLIIFSSSLLKLKNIHQS